MNRLLAADDVIKANLAVNNYWTEFWQEMESRRWGGDSRYTYREIKAILKYNLAGKRDGGIINKVRSEDGTIISNSAEVEIQLAQTIEEIQIDPNFEYMNRTSFPILPILTAGEVEQLLERLASNKAISFDCLNDTIFKKIYVKRTSEIFRDLWSIDLAKISGIQASFTSRLIPLNKAYPDISNRT